MRTQLNGGSGFFGQELRLSDNRSFVLYIYTDGSAKDEPRIQKCAGWRFTAMTKRPRLGDKPMIKACGPVQISKCEGILHRCQKSHRSTVLAEHVRGTQGS